MSLQGISGRRLMHAQEARSYFGLEVHLPPDWAQETKTAPKCGVVCRAFGSQC